MKRTVFILLAALALLGAWSCSQEYWEEQEAKKEAAAKEKAVAFWDVVGQLVSSKDIGADYKNRTFEPVIGEPDPSDPQARIVATNDLETARQRFANLIGEDVGKIGASYTYKNDEVGTLVYTEGGGSSLATVEVNIKQIPHLSRIRYATPEQKGENGKFEGAAYYRFGDVISIEQEDGRKDYWMCVRPAFGKDGKENTHWISVSKLGAENVFNYPSTKASNKREYNIPDKLKYNTEHMENFAELLFAVCYPNEWHDNVTDIPKMKMFHDMDKENIRFHNEAFFTNVQSAWRRLNILNGMMGFSYEEFAPKLKSEGLHFIYGNCDWNTWFYNGPKLNYATYKYEKGTVKSNMKASTYESKRIDVINKKDPTKDCDFNVLKETTKRAPYLVKPDYFGDDAPRWIVRYATGADLSETGKYGDNDVRSPIPGTTVVYRYYEHVLKTDDLANSNFLPEVSGLENETGHQDRVNDYDGVAHYAVGDVLKDEKGHIWMVVCIGGNMKTFDVESNAKETMPFAELVSFQGLTPTADKSSFMDLPTRDQAIRGTLWIWSIFNYAAVYADEAINNAGERSGQTYVRITKNLRDAATVDFRRLLMITQAGSGYVRSPNNTVCVGYKDPSVTGKQPMLRFSYNNDKYSDENPKFHFWAHYPKTPDNTTQLWEKSSDFSTEQIYLQDIADENKVKAHAKDFYAGQPLMKASGGDGETRREPRSQTDSQALDVTNYIYSYDIWNLWKYPLDMWNEQCLFFRMDRVYDRGDGSYATVSEAGHTLTLYRRPYGFFKTDYFDYEDVLGEYRSVYASRNAIWVKNEGGQDFWLDGSVIKIPSWKSAWPE